MKANLVLFALPFLIGMVASGRAVAQESASSGPALAHTRTEFHFVVNASFEQTAPLFGANQERKWALDWDPHFVYPNPAHDQPGMVFRVERPNHSSVWVNTAFDLAAGHVQYVYVLNDAMTTLIDIHLTHESADITGVSVVYERTALAPEANEHVQHFTQGDEKAGKEWGDAINAYFTKTNGKVGQK